MGKRKRKHPCCDSGFCIHMAARNYNRSYKIKMTYICDWVLSCALALLIITLTLLMVSMSFVGCSSPIQAPERNVFYERDLYMEVNDHKFWGVGVVPESEFYKMKIHAHGDNDWLGIKTCNRHKRFENEGGKVKYTYYPVDELENTSKCPIEVISLDHKGRHGWGLLILSEPKKYSMPAYMKCNGEQGAIVGVSICQSKTGLVQELKFSEDMLMVGSKECEIDQAADRKSFKYTMNKGQCVFTFGRVAEPHLLHLHYTVGYDETLLRKD